MRELMQLYASRIEEAYRDHGIGVVVVGGAQSAHLLSFRLATDPTVKVGRILTLEADVALALGVETARVRCGRGCVVVEVPSPRFVAVKAVPPKHGLITGLGRDPWNKPLYLNLGSDQAAHLLIVGATGSGKTVLLQTMICSMAQNPLADVSLLLIDPKNGQAFGNFKDLAHLVHPVISRPAEGAAALRWAFSEITRREQGRGNSPPLIIVIDELLGILLAAGSEFEVCLQQIATRGRSAGVHLVAATQHATAEVLGSSTIKSQFTARVVGKVMSASDSNLATGIAGLEAHKLLGKGDFLAVIAGQVKRFQAAKTTLDDLRTLPRNGTAPHPDILSATTVETNLITWPRPRRAGRPAKRPTRRMLDWIQDHWQRIGEWPSARAIRAAFNCNNRRAQEALSTARNAERNGTKTEERGRARGNATASV